MMFGSTQVDCVIFRSRRVGAPFIGLAVLTVIVLSTTTPARADSIQDAVLNFSGPTWAAISHTTNITALDFAAAGTPTSGFSPTDIITALDFAAAGTPTSGFSATDIIDPSDNDNKGVFSMNIDLTGSTINSVIDPFTGGPDYTYTLTNTQNDFLTEQVYDTNTPRVIFDSKHNVVQTVSFGYMDLGAGFNVYWFAFQQGAPSRFAKGGDLIGGYMLDDSGSYSDIKTFDTAPAPATGYYASALIFISAMGLWHLGRRVFRGGPVLSAAA